MASYCICSKCHPLISLSDHAMDQQQQQQQHLWPVQLGGPYWCMLVEFYSSCIQGPDGVRTLGG